MDGRTWTTRTTAVLQHWPATSRGSPLPDHCLAHCVTRNAARSTNRAKFASVTPQLWGNNGGYVMTTEFTAADRAVGTGRCACSSTRTRSSKSSRHRPWRTTTTLATAMPPCTPIATRPRKTAHRLTKLWSTGRAVASRRAWIARSRYECTASQPALVAALAGLGAACTPTPTRSGGLRWRRR